MKSVSNRTRKILQEVVRCWDSPKISPETEDSSVSRRSEDLGNNISMNINNDIPKPTNIEPKTDCYSETTAIFGMTADVWHGRENETQTYLLSNLENNEVENVLQQIELFVERKVNFDVVPEEVDDTSPCDDGDADMNYSPGEDNSSTSSSSDDEVLPKEIKKTIGNPSLRSSDEALPREPKKSSRNPSLSSGDEVPPKKPKKTIRNPSAWKRNIKKKKVNSGEQYCTKEGKIKRGKRLKQGCTERCRIKCGQKINEESRLKIFNSFYKECGNKNMQRNFINSCISPTKPRKYRNAKPDSKRSLNYTYHFKIENEKINVCKYFFKNTLDLSNTAISTAIAKKNDIGLVLPDARGCHNNHKKLDECLRQDVIDHINTFARIESHYCRKDNQREFIDGGLTISEMYRLYVEVCKAKGKNRVKYSMYAHIFNTCFNIGFFRPKKDLCALCDQYMHASDKSILQDKYDLHQSEKELSRKEKSKDIELTTSNKDTNAMFVFDLQAVIPLPCGNVSNFYYKSKLNCLNFTVFDFIDKAGISYLWHEGEARRGSNEISSCVFNLLINKCIGKHVIFYSDNCGGQNKNKFMAAMYLYVVKNYDVKSITHKFLIAGHSQNEGDSMHSCIESSKKRALLSGPLYTPHQVEMVIKLAKKTGKPYMVNNIKYTDILDWKSFSKNFGQFTKNTNGEKVFWSNIKVLRIIKEDPNTIYYKETFNTEVFKKIIVVEKKNYEDNQLGPAYTERPRITYKKKEDLLSLLKHIPTEHQDFFKNLKAFKKGQKVQNEDSDE